MNGAMDIPAIKQARVARQNARSKRRTRVGLPRARGGSSMVVSFELRFEKPRLFRRAPQRKKAQCMT
jgi:hypothetical protein